MNARIRNKRRIADLESKVAQLEQNQAAIINAQTELKRNVTGMVPDLNYNFSELSRFVDTYNKHIKLLHHCTFKSVWHSLKKAWKEIKGDK